VSSEGVITFTPVEISVEDEPEIDPPIDIVDELDTNKAARWPFPVWDRPLTDIKWITVHHSAGSRDTQNIAWWDRYHREYKSWSRVGYHFGISAWEPGDEIKLYQLNRLSTVSWHDTKNYQTVGVCMSGDLRAGHDVRPNDVQLECFGRLMAWLVPQLPRLEGIVGHKYWQATACPGDMHLWGDELVAAAAQYGQEIGPLMVEQQTTRSNLFKSFATFRLPTAPTPPRDDYDEHLGMGDQEG
jgi:hypothetical protein